MLLGGTKVPFASAGFFRLKAGVAHDSGGDIIGEAAVFSLTVGLGAVLN